MRTFAEIFGRCQTRTGRISGRPCEERRRALPRGASSHSTARRTRFWFFAAVALTPLLGVSQSLHAHGDLSEQIEAVTVQIARTPQDAELYLRRGELYRAHGDWPAARADYDKAAALAPGWPTVDLVRGRFFLAVGAFTDAKQALDRFLSVEPTNVQGLVARALALKAGGQPLAAVADFDKAIEAASQPDPDFYLQRAQALVAAGTEHIDEAIRGLDEGLQRLGHPVTLTLSAIDLEIMRGRVDAALRRLEEMSARSPRKERWLARRGEILEQAKRQAEAREAYTAAVAAIDALPDYRRGTKAVADLRARLENKLRAGTE